MVKKIFFIAFFFPWVSLMAQNWKFIEQRSGRNVPLVILETYDKGLLFPVSNPDVPSYSDVFLYKLNVNGELQWKKNFQYKNHFFETTNVLELKDGGYIIAGSTDVLDSDLVTGGDPFLLKLNNCFEPEWFNIYNEPGDYNRIDHVIEYEGKLLVSFAYLKINYITIALMDLHGRFMKKTTIPEIFTDKVYVKKDKTIQIIAYSGVFGLLANPDVAINKGILINMDSNLNIKLKQYYHLADTTFDNNSFDLCYIDSTEYNFLTLGTLRQPNPYNKDVDGCVMITKNHDDKEWYKIINDTSKYVSGQHMIKLDNNRFAITCDYNPDNTQHFWGYVQNFIIDSNANVIYSAFENPGPRNSLTNNLLRTSDGNLVTIGSQNRVNDDWDIYCYKYNPDLTPFIKKNIIKNYDTLCSKALSSSTIQLPEPKIYNLENDSFLSSIKPIGSDPLNLSIFPNPGNGKINIKTASDYMLHVFDVTGRDVLFVENEPEINLPKGIYFFHFQIDGTHIVRRVVVL